MRDVSAPPQISPTGGFTMYIEGKPFRFIHIGNRRIRCKWCGRVSNLDKIILRHGIEGTVHDPGCPAYKYRNFTPPQRRENPPQQQARRVGTRR
jgi:hypothetical protein